MSSEHDTENAGRKAEQGTTNVRRVDGHVKRGICSLQGENVIRCWFSNNEGSRQSCCECKLCIALVSE